MWGRHCYRWSDLDFEANKPGTSNGIFDLKEVEKEHIKKVLQHAKSNKTKTANLLGIGLTTLYRKMEEYKISY